MAKRKKIDGTNGDDTLHGTAGDDDIRGFAGRDIILADAGNDKIDAGSGNNDVLAMAGNDTVQAGDGNDFIWAGDGDDWVDAGNGDNLVLGEAGDDHLRSGRGNDNLVGGDGNDWIDAGDGNNIVDAGAGDNTIKTGSGADTISAIGGNNRIDAGNGNNNIRAGGNTGAQRIKAGSGDDDISTGGGSDWIDAGHGNNRIGAGSGNDTIKAGNGDDDIFGGGGSNTIDAGNGNNIIETAGGGNDRIKSGNGNDLIELSDGDDRIDAGGGNDTLSSGGGSDTVNAGAGNDLFQHFPFDHSRPDISDVYRGGSGLDTLRLELTTAEWVDNGALQLDVAAYSEFLARVTGNGTREAGNRDFQFQTFGLRAGQIENLVVDVDGIVLTSDTQVIGTSTGTVQEDGVQFTSGKLTALTLDPGLSAFLLPSAPDQGYGPYGHFEWDESGNWAFFLRNSDTLVQALNDTPVHQTLELTTRDGTKQLLDVTIHGANDAPTDITLAPAVVDENAPGAVIGTLTTADVDAGDTHTYTLSDARFEVAGDALKLKDGISLDHEAEHQVTIDITATDAAGASVSDVLTIDVANVNEAPVATTSFEQRAFTLTASIDIDSYFSDPDGDPIAVGIEAPNGYVLFIDASTSTLTFTFPSTTPSPYHIVLTAEDAGGLKASVDFQFGT